MLKLLLFLSDISIPFRHLLTKLYDTLPEKDQKRLESTYQVRRSVLPDGYN